MFERILVAVDGSTNSDRAVEAAAEVARAHGSTLSICHAFHIPDHYKADLADELEEALEGDAERILSHAAGVAEEAAVAAETKLLKKGHPVEAVVAYAEELGVDLIVVGVRGRTPDQGRAMGSVSAAVTEQASCSVLLVRGR
ncbi:universal stress protein [bacterium]|nr:universal stress protein [bacterium]